MPRLDGLKEDLGYLKFCFGIVVATFLALVGWIATNYTAASVLLLVCAFVRLLGVSIKVCAIAIKRTIKTPFGRVYLA